MEFVYSWIRQRQFFSIVRLPIIIIRIMYTQDDKIVITIILS